MMYSIVCRQAITWLAFCCLVSGMRVSMAQETTDSAGTATETAGAADGGASAAEEPQTSASGDVETEAESEATDGGESTESAMKWYLPRKFLSREGDSMVRIFSICAGMASANSLAQSA